MFQKAKTSDTLSGFTATFMKLLAKKDELRRTFQKYSTAANMFLNGITDDSNHKVANCFARYVISVFTRNLIVPNPINSCIIYDIVQPILVLTVSLPYNFYPQICQALSLNF